MPRRKRRYKKKLPKPPEPVPEQIPESSYASIMVDKSDVQQPDPIRSPEIAPNVASIPVSSLRRRDLNGHHAWELAYFRQILELRAIFIDGMKRIAPYIDSDDFRSSWFLENFSRFIFEISNKTISDPDELNGELSELYYQYLIKRDE